MYKILLADKDTYITNRIINSERKVTASVGSAATLDLFKLYSSGSKENIENSRILIHFNLDDLRSLHENKTIDINDNSFWCNLVLKDVYGGQTTPSNFDVNIFPLSASFNEGLGKDNSYFSDKDSANWLSSSFETKWYEEGCSKDVLATTAGDYITGSSSIAATKITQNFKTGEEDLIVDVTRIISATINKEIPDEGFRISFADSLEKNKKSYFVKRFGSRTIYDETKRPKLIFGFDDSVTDDSQNLYFDETGSIKLYNYSQRLPANIVSASQYLTGTNCLSVKLVSQSSGSYTTVFSGSQLFRGINPVSGVYSSNIYFSSTNPSLKNHLLTSGSIDFTPIWMSKDESVVFLTGSSLTVRSPNRSTSKNNFENYIVAITNLKKEYHISESEEVRINIFDYTSPTIKLTKKAIENKGIVVKNCYYSVRESSTNQVIIPFDSQKNSTKVSSDSEGMFFKLDFSNLIAGRNFVIDLEINDKGNKKRYLNVSQAFKITANGN